MSKKVEVNPCFAVIFCTRILVMNLEQCASLAMVGIRLGYQLGSAYVAFTIFQF
jgi:hypothetical protein